MSATNWTNVTSVADILAVPNTLTDSWFWLGMLFMIVLVVLIVIVMKNNNIEIAMMVAGFVGLVGGIFLTYLNLVGWERVLVFVGLLVMSFLYIIYSSNRDNV